MNAPRPRRLPGLAAIALLAIAASSAGCGGGGGGAEAATAPPACASASAWNGSRCEPFAKRVTERAATPFAEAGTPVTLEVVIFEPLAAPPHPLVVFHHGSTGNGDNPAAFRVTTVNEAVARFFATRGWAVAFPQRRGRGTSGGLYDEGFEPDRSRYSCRQELASPGVERALQDADAALEHLRARPGVDASRILLAGHSRGGILAVAQAGRRPDAVRGAVNFAGGWLGEGCVDAVAVNRAASVLGAASPHPTLWLYAAGDSFYSIAHSRSNFAAFTGAGGRGTFLEFARSAGLEGHFLPDDPPLWGADVDRYLGERFPG